LKTRMRENYSSSDRNVCLLAPLRRPKPMATAGAIMGKLAISEIVAIPLRDARSYQYRVASTDFCAEECR